MAFDVSPNEEKNTSDQSIHPLVQAKIAELQGHPKSITFPAESPDANLKALDYQHFLSLLQDKLNQFGLAQLDHLSLNCDSKAAFDGLNAFIKAQGAKLPCKKLTLNLDALNTGDLSHLESFINSLQNANLEDLRLIDTKQQYTEAMATNLLEVVKKQRITTEISLPEHLQKTDAQRNLDETISTQTFESMQQKQLQEFKSVEAKTLNSVSLPPRKRPRNTANQGIFIDVEQERQQGYQLDTVNQTSKTNDSQSESKEKNARNFYDLETFSQAYRRWDFTSYSKSFLVDEEALSELWMNWVGALTQKEVQNHAKILISKEACEQLLRFKDQFSYGFDFLEGSPGFSVDEHQGSKRIDFDEGLKNTAAYNPLQVQTLEAAEKRALPHNVFQKWLDNTADDNPVKQAWNALNKETYDREAHRIFKQALPQILALETRAQKSLLDLCFLQGPCKPQLLKFLLDNARQLRATPHFENNSYLRKTLAELGGSEFASKEFIKNYQETQPDFDKHLLSLLIAEHEQESVRALLQQAPYLNRNALVQLYLHEGFKGLNKLGEVIRQHPKTFEKVHQQAYQNTSNYLPLLDENFTQALSAIAGFPRNANNDENYWDVLFKEHCKYQAEIDVVDLVNTYKAFNQKIAHLTTTNRLPLEFPLTCKLKNIRNFKVFLSRLYTLMNNTSEFNRTAQWNEIEELDFASRGFIKLSQKPSNFARCSFFTHEMQFSPNTEANSEGYTFKRNIAAFKKNEEPFESKEFARDFFRFVSNQSEDKQQSLAFYRKLYARVQELNCSVDMKKSLLILIACSSTSSSSVRVPTETAILQAEKIIELLTTGILGRVTTAATVIIKSLLTLQSAPSLNQLLLLLKTITSCPYRRLGELQKANQTLIAFVGKYGSYVFKGMKHYSTNDYSNDSLFFNHIDILANCSINNVTESCQKVNRCLINNVTEVQGTLRWENCRWSFI